MVIGRLVLVASVLFAGCVAVPLGGFDGGEEPCLQEAVEPPVPSGPGRFLSAYYRDEPQRHIDVGLQIVFPGAEKIDSNDPDAPRYNEVWKTAIGLAAYYRGGVTAEFYYYGGLALAFMTGKRYDYLGTDIRLSDEVIVDLGGGVQYRKEMGSATPYGRVGAGLIFWPSTEMEALGASVDIFASSTNLFLELGGGVSFAVGSGQIYFDLGYTFGPEPELASGLMGATGKYNPFTITIGGSFAF